MFEQILFFGHTIVSDHCRLYKEDGHDLLFGGDDLLLLATKLVFLLGAKEYILLGVKEPILLLLVNLERRWMGLSSSSTRVPT